MQALAITGATGFLGQHFVSECISQGRFNLRLLLRDTKAFQHHVSDAVSICEGDLLIPESLEGFLLPGSTLIHLAYLGNDGNADIEATSNLIKVVKQSGVKRVVHCSTAVVIGFKAKGVVTEDTIPEPRGEYQLSKLRIEEMLHKELSPTVELSVLRPTHILGPGGQGLQRMIKRLRNDKSYKNAIYHSILKHRRFNYVSVYNVVAALILLATTPIRQAGEIYNISDDDDNDNNYAATEKIINLCLNHKHEHFIDIGLPRSVLSFLFKALPDHSPPSRVYSHAKISSLGYKKVVSLQSAITEMMSLGGNSAHS